MALTIIFTIKLQKSCSIQNNSVPLQSQSRIDLADIIKKRLLALVLVSWNPENFTNPKQEGSKRPLGYVYPAAERPHVDCSVWWHFICGVGVACIFLLVGSFRNLKRENKQRVRYHAFFVVRNAGLVPTAEKQHAIQLIWVRNLSPNSLSPLLVCLWLCPQQVQAPTIATKPIYCYCKLYLLWLVGLEILDSYCYYYYPLIPKWYRYWKSTYKARKESCDDCQHRS